MFIQMSTFRVSTRCLAAGQSVMHDSMQRLLAFAREVTADLREPVHSFSDLGRKLGKSSAVITNWKARGISVQGAMDASAVFGCSPQWVLTGEGEPRGDVLRNHDQAFDAYLDWHAGAPPLSASDRQVLRDLALLLPSERDTWVSQLHERAEKVREDLTRWFTERGLPVPSLEQAAGDRRPGPGPTVADKPSKNPPGDRLLGGASQLGALDEAPVRAPRGSKKRASS